MLYLSQYTLSFTEARELRLTDGYSDAPRGLRPF